MDIDCTYKGSPVKIIDVDMNGRDTYVLFVSGSPSGMYRDTFTNSPASGALPYTIATNVTSVA